MPTVSSRLAPALGLAAACAMLTGVGVIAISTASGTGQPTEIAGAVLLPTSAPARVTPSLAAKEKSTRPSSHRPSETAPSSAGSTPTQPGPDPSSVSTSAGPSSPASDGTTPPATTASAPAPSSTSGGGLTGAPPLRTTTGTTRDTMAQAVFEAVNQARAAHNLPPLQWSSALQTSAHRHNLAMAQANTLSHQVDGEPSLGARETAAGVDWTFAAENIGWTTEQTEAGALDIENRMAGETAPNDAHKRNILTTSATSLGVDVYIDAAHGRLWLTEDFSG